MRHRLAALILCVGISFLPPGAQAQWQIDGVPICTAVSGQFSPHIVSDGAGGAIVTWYDGRSGGFDYPIYAQRVDASGVSQWTANGVALSAAAGDDPAIVSDGAGGAIVAWAGAHAQRVNASGVPQWTANGVALSTAASGKVALSIVSDGAEGAIAAWLDFRSGSWDVYAQRVNASGVLQWPDTAVVICSVANQPFPYPSGIDSDGAGGAIVTWQDYRSGASPAIYAQRVNVAGVPQWTANGVALSAAGFKPAIVSDGAGGAIVTWDGAYAQRVNESGVPQWTANGVALSTAADTKVAVTIVSDGVGGAIVAWEDHRSGADIYAQRVDTAGARLWAADGVALCAAVGNQFSPMIGSDGAGGAIATWEDGRSGVTLDIYSQRVNASGTPQWTSDGVVLCIAANDQFDPMIVLDGTGGAIVTWEDTRTGPYDIYAQHVTDPLNTVAIVSFDATEVGGVVTLRSAFRSDLGVEAVNVYRGVGIAADLLAIIERVDDVRGDHFEYVDRDIAPGQTYRYRIGAVDADGEFFSPTVTVSVGMIAAELSQNQPNPFNPTTTIRFVLPVREQVTLAIYDANGRLVRTLVNEVRGYGAHEVTWDGRGDDGAAMGSGVYFYRLNAGKRTESKKMVLLK